jgi:hypothetical protein
MVSAPAVRRHTTSSGSDMALRSAWRSSRLSTADDDDLDAHVEAESNPIAEEGQST